jgi:hypothetical protein
MKVKKCCEEADNKVQPYMVLQPGNIISTDFMDDYFNIEGIKYCMFCGKKLEIE